MTSKKRIRTFLLPALAMVLVTVAAGPSFAQNLVALKATTTMPDGASMPMWGFFPDTGQACGAVDQWAVGPALSAVAGGPLSVTVRNCLDEPISFFVPGQYKATTPVMFTDAQGRQRVRSFDLEIPAGQSRTYGWANLKEGTYIYHSGTQPQKQVQMGLYGALMVSGTASPPVAAEKLLVYSEVDPVLHAAVAAGTYGTAGGPTSTFDYAPQYFLINGKAFPDTSAVAVGVGQDVRLRFVNAGLKTRVPTLQGLYMTLIAEDGNLFSAKSADGTVNSFPREQYSTELPPGKTMDAVINVGAAGQYALYDRALGLVNAKETGGGMLTFIQAGSVTGAPSASSDTYQVAEDGTVAVAAPGVLGNDTDPDSQPLSAVLVSSASAGLLTLNANGSFTYNPNPNFNGFDSFTYRASDGTNPSNLATATITVTPVPDTPVAANDAYAVPSGQQLSIGIPGVLANDSDADGDSLSAALSGTAPLGLSLNPNGSFGYGPAGAAGSTVQFQYVVNDGTSDSAPATVTISVTAAPGNVAPVANDDSWQTRRNTPITLSVTQNDVDPDGSVNVATVDLNPSTPLVRNTTVTTQAGGTATVDNLGNVTFTPKRGFRGTDSFSYLVKDNQGLNSNIARVQVNVL